MNSTSKNNVNNSYNSNENGEKSTVDRQWVALTAYQPVDIVTKTVEVPVIKTVEKIVPKTIIQEKIIHVPKNVTHVVEKIVEVPEVKYIEKIVEVPHIQYKNKYVPKIEVVEKIIEKQKIIEKWHNKTVEVPEIREVIRYKEIEDVEEVIKYIPKDSGNIDWEGEYKKYLQTKEMGNYVSNDAVAYQQNINSYNNYNEQTYVQNAYNRASEYVNNAHRDTSAINNKDSYLQNCCYTQYNKSSFEQSRCIPRSRLEVESRSPLKRLPSEDVKPVGCCSGRC